MSIFRTKDLNTVKESSSKAGLKKTLTAIDLILLGIGAVVGTGVFVLIGSASQYSGPGLLLSFLMSGIACMFVALAYIEVASMIPTSGSVYTYSYVAFGELIAWMTCWLLVIEFAISGLTVAAGWSSYLVEILRHGGIVLPKALTTVPSEGGIINLPATLITLFVTSILIKGTKESAKLNTILVIVKLAAIFIFLIVAVPHFSLTHWQDFMPNGFKGIATGAAAVLIAFTGFDSLATAVEECKNPKRDIVIGVLGSLLACTVLYMCIAGMLTGIVDYKELNNAKPLAHAFNLNGSNIGSALVATGGVAAMVTVLIMNIYAQSRVFFVAARDGLLPKFFTKLHPKYETPYVSTIIVGVSVAVVSGLMPIKIASHLACMGTLAVFMIAALVVMVLRVKLPNAERPFRCPLVYLVGTLAILSCGYLFIQLIPTVGKYFVLWNLAGLVIYFGYSYRASRNSANMLQ